VRGSQSLLQRALAQTLYGRLWYRVGAELWWEVRKEIKIGQSGNSITSDMTEEDGN
jgi:hypothetical protein